MESERKRQIGRQREGKIYRQIESESYFLNDELKQQFTDVEYVLSETYFVLRRSVVCGCVYISLCLATSSNCLCLKMLFKLNYIARIGCLTKISQDIVIVQSTFKYLIRVFSILNIVLFCSLVAISQWNSFVIYQECSNLTSKARQDDILHFQVKIPI